MSTLKMQVSGEQIPKVSYEDRNETFSSFKHWSDFSLSLFWFSSPAATSSKDPLNHSAVKLSSLVSVFPFSVLFSLVPHSVFSAVFSSVLSFLAVSFSFPLSVTLSYLFSLLVAAVILFLLYPSF